MKCSVLSSCIFTWTGSYCAYFFRDLYLFIFACQGPLYINAHSGIDSLSLWWYVPEHGYDTNIFHWWWALEWLSGWLLTNNADKNALDFIGGHYLWRTLASPWQFICLCHTSVGILVDSTATNERSNCPPVSWTQFFPFFYDWNGNSSRRGGYIFIFIVLDFIFLITK